MMRVRQLPPTTAAWQVTNVRPNGAVVSRRSDLILIASTALVFLVVVVFSNLEKALAFSVLFAVFLSIVQTKRESWSDRRFWFILSVLALAHIAVLSVINIPELKFGLIVLPFALLDGFAIYWFLNWIERRFPAQR